MSADCRHYESEIILLGVRWYPRYALSYRDLEERMNERGLLAAHKTIYRRVQAYAPETARRTIGGYEIMNIIRKWQVEGIGKDDIRGQVRFVADLFNGAA